MKVKAYAKINLALDVIGLRDDGYHELNMIMAPITLHDLIYINRIDHGIKITSNTYRMPTDERNIMYKIAQALIDTYSIDGGVRIHCYKHIPTQAGLGGGSADGAAVMRAMNRLFHLRMSYQDMIDFSKNIGADIPFCIENRLAVVQGIGEQLTFIDESQFTAHLLLVKPSKGVSTKRCFDVIDTHQYHHPDIDKMAKAIQIDDYHQVVDCLGNSMEKPSMMMVEEIAEIKEEMLKLGFDGALMSGSGSTVFGITREQSIVDHALPYFQKKYAFVRKADILTNEMKKYKKR